MSYNCEESKVTKDVLDAIDNIKKLQVQRQNPDRNGMIAVLQDAQKTAPMEILMLELFQGDSNWMLFENFTDYGLYCKLAQYQEGLAIYCIEKIGKELFDKLLNG
jgi:hypothetical protein